jgi:hypothetical protein
MFKIQKLCHSTLHCGEFDGVGDVKKGDTLKKNQITFVKNNQSDFKL